MEGRRDLFEPLLDRLASGPATIAELEEVLRGKTDIVTLMYMIVVLDGTNQLQAARLTPADPEPSRRLNRVLADDWSGPYRYVAAPETGGALEACSNDLLLLNRLLHGAEPTVDALVGAVAEHLKLVREEDLAMVRGQVTRFVESVIPVWRAAGVVAREGERALPMPRIAAVS